MRRYYCSAFLTNISTPILSLLILGCVYFFSFSLLPQIQEQPGGGIIPILFGAPLLVFSGKIIAHILPRPPSSIYHRLLPLVGAGFLLMLAFIPYTLSEQSVYRGLFDALYFFLFIGVPFIWLGIIWGLEKIEKSTHTKQGAIVFGLIILVLGVGDYATFTYVDRNVLRAPNPSEATVDHGVNTYFYMPFKLKNLLAKPDSAPSFSISSNYPRLDGAIAALPVYAAVAQALYSNLDVNTVKPYVDCFNTTEAFERLLKGEVDIFFGAPPSKAQWEAATALGITLTETPIAWEAFVFLVNKNNPVNALSLDQIRDIYSKKITRWKDVGGSDESIVAFQRPANSGSQTAMENLVMKETSLREPIREEYIKGMGGLIKQVAAYRNGENAIGYSFRWYASVQFPSPDIKFLAINDTEPSIENIQNGRYPLTTHLVAVTARPLSQQSQGLLNWMLSAEGQNLVERAGYVPLQKKLPVQ